MHSRKGKHQPSHRFKPKDCKAKDDKALRLTILALAHEKYFDVFEPNINITHGRASEMLSKIMS
jgi:hypothetical protein